MIMLQKRLGDWNMNIYQHMVNLEEHDLLIKVIIIIIKQKMLNEAMQKKDRTCKESTQKQSAEETQ